MFIKIHNSVIKGEEPSQSSLCDASSLWEGAFGAPASFPLQPESYCLPSACRDAPLGQRQGGVFRVPPPYLWTPPTPQRAKGCTPLTILKKKSKHKKASAAPVGAIALTLFSLLHLKPLSRCATAPPRGSERPPPAPRFRRKRRCICRFPLRHLP